MTRTKKKIDLWHFSAGEYGSTVEVREREAGGMLYVRYWDPEQKAQVYTSLRHRDREKAKQYAREQADLIKQGRAPAGAITVAELLRLYLIHRTPQKKSAKGRKEDHRRAAMFTKLWGRMLCTDVTVADWNAFKAKRTTGAIDAHGVPVHQANREPAGAATVAHDGRFIRSVFYWGMAWLMPGGQSLLARNPFGAPAKGVKSAFELPKNTAPRRPVISDARFQKVREAAERVFMEARKGEAGTELVTLGVKRHGPKKTESPNRRHMKVSYLPEMLDLAWWTGRRRDAIRTLRYSDLVREGGDVVAIRWRATKHAEQSEVVPLAAAAREAVKRVLVQRPGVGDTSLFPSFSDPSVPINATACDKWLRKAEELAGVEHQTGGLWHPHRRSWNSKRQHLPVKARMRAGGWKTERVLRESYEQADDDLVLEVLEEPRVMVERSG